MRLEQTFSRVVTFNVHALRRGGYDHVIVAIETKILHLIKVHLIKVDRIHGLTMVYVASANY